MKAGNVQALMNLGVEDQELLWKSICRLAVARTAGAAAEGDVDSTRQDFNRINTMINPSAPAELQCLPLRVHRLDLGQQATLVPAAYAPEATLGQALERLQPAVDASTSLIVQGIEVPIAFATRTLPHTLILGDV